MSQNFVTVAEQRVGDCLVEIQVIESGVTATGIGPLPARGLVKLWPLNEKGERNRRVHYPSASFHFDADGWEQFAALAANVAATVRNTP